MDDIRYYLALFHAPGIGDKLFHAICDFLDQQHIPIGELFKQPKLLNELLESKKKCATNAPSSIHILTEKKLQGLNRYLDKEALQSHSNQSQIEKELNWQEQANQHIIFSHDGHYPELLKQIDSPPAVIFVMGDPSLLKKVQLAIVGSRTPTPSGSETAYHFSHFLAQAGMVITSGMALGIDTAAHRGCLDAHGKTIAVAGTGLDRVYPAKNKTLAHQIAEQGALISCFALGTAPSRANFPKRNQIISGLSVGALVVEAALQSGSLITARLAMEQGREVFAIPGSIHSPLSRGCHALIKQGAKLVEDAEDIVEEIINLSIASQLNSTIVENQASQAPPPHKPKQEKNIDPLLPKDQRQLLSYMDCQPISLDQLADRSQLAIDDISSMLLLLELQGHIETLPGGKICRCC